MNNPSIPPPRSTSFIVGVPFQEAVKSSQSNDNILSLGVDRLPFSSRKFPASLSNEQRIHRKTLGDKVKDFFLHNQNKAAPGDLEEHTDICNVEDLLKKYTDTSSCLEPEVCGDEDFPSGTMNASSGTLQGDNVSYSSLSNLSNTTDISESCATASGAYLNPKISIHHSFVVSGHSEAQPFSINRSSSACETCKSQDSGFSDCSKSPQLNGDSGKGIFASFITKGIFSRIRGPDPIKESLSANSNQKKKSDDFMTKTTQTWITDILPKWERGARSWRQTHELWWLGLPPKVRGSVWKLAIGNELNITEDLYKVCLDRAACVFNHIDSKSTTQRSPTPTELLFSKLSLSKNEPNNVKSEDDSSKLHDADLPLLQSLPSILLDLSRTFPQLGLFQQGGPLHGALKNLLSAYTSYRPDIGYVQGMSFIASMLLLNMDEFDAFVAFTNLINKPLHMAMFSVDRRRIAAYVATYKKMLWSLMPELAGHFAAQRLSPDVYLFEWLLPIYCKSFSLDVVSRLWDVYLRDGENFLFKVALAILKQNEAGLLASDFDQIIAILANIRSQADLTSGEQLFTNIRAISKTRVASSESFAKLLEESIALDADRWCESNS